MRKVELRMKEQEKYEVIKELVDHKGNKNRASKKLGITRRQINRLIITYKEKGKSVLFMETAQSNLYIPKINQSPKILYYYTAQNIKTLILNTSMNI